MSVTILILGLCPPSPFQTLSCVSACFCTAAEDMIVWSSSRLERDSFAIHVAHSQLCHFFNWAQTDSIRFKSGLFRGQLEPCLTFDYVPLKPLLRWDSQWAGEPSSMNRVSIMPFLCHFSKEIPNFIQLSFLNGLMHISAVGANCQKIQRRLRISPICLRFFYLQRRYVALSDVINLFPRLYCARAHVRDNFVTPRHPFMGL